MANANRDGKETERGASLMGDAAYSVGRNKVTCLPSLPAGGRKGGEGR